ncbi:wax ester/triacylglycerol synthase domain-containing protein [Amycolatopsis sp. NPDC021455]|uniref:wax ester/triacylglycerol synthase domain-containing protein n=1 Tax=Amycolatopsis sp. NPDC021455 TaxID=3154901 RepID=UPI0033D1D792
MERLTAEDRLMLWPDRLWPQDIGAVAVLDGTPLADPDGRFRIDVVRRAVEARLHLVPRFRQLLVTPLPGLGGPLWTDAPVFGVSDHVRVLPLDDPADEARFLHAVENVRARRMDRSRPLWEMWFFPGLAGGRVGLFVRMHHAIGDGIAGVATLGAFLDAAPGPVRAWTPAPWPPASTLMIDNLRRRTQAAVAVLRRPRTALASARAAWPQVPRLFKTPPTSPTSLDRVVGPGRSFAFIRAELDAVRQAAHRHDATINDVLLTAVAGGLDALFRARGESVEDRTVPVYVPVTLRPAQHRDQARGNSVGQMIVPLPLGVADPGSRLRRIAAETTRRKAVDHADLGTAFRSPLARLALLKFLERHPVSVTTADVPGPPQPVHLAGARLLEIFPLLPLIARVPLGIGALSYAGQFTVTVVADRDAVPDFETFAESARDELGALTVIASRDHQGS